MTDTPIARALISVSDKTDLIDFARYLNAAGVEILSTGGSAKAMRDAGIAVTEVADHTGSPEILDGRVKTLHPKIHGGILGRRDLADHLKQMDDHGIAPIDMVVVNLYPFEATVARGAPFDECIENIDIGGPALLRAAAKNHASVTVITDPAQYADVQAAMAANKGATSAVLRRKFAEDAYAHTAYYDGMIANWFAQQRGAVFPDRLLCGGALQQKLRYGENPHQEAALYLGGPARIGVATAEQIQGKELSYNNLNDTDAAFELVSEFNRPACAIIKHANPCGVALGDTLSEAYTKALSCDPVSAFGGIIALNEALNAEIATKIAGLFAEVVIAPGADDKAREILSAKKNLRVLLTSAMADPAAPGLALKSIAGGFLAMSRDNGHISENDIKVVTKKDPTPQQIRDLLFAFTVCKHVKSNAIIYVQDGVTVGIGAGQMSRVDSARIAALKSKDAAEAAGEKGLRTEGSVVASDAFFPFADGLLAAIDAGAKAVIQPGGSIRDEEVIAAADEAGIAMVFTGMRHFRH
ncbi:MAG: bifunctional phosphoribosylaminoimidazolecarboxamide formyltransferase/IMP cyclohydrolase [Proteobacteria bacterium]|nr:bifunctional phosphoribosylaminoimidazolecarboxamide formyltransferase/IMP cyclohydrolase [Pseudomonadota bacterium]